MQLNVQQKVDLCYDRVIVYTEGETEKVEGSEREERYREREREGERE